MLNMTAVGRIGRDAELRHTPNGDAVCNVAIGCNYGRKGDDGKQPTQWVDGSLWGARAEALVEYLTKGKQVVLVLSDVHIETYQGQNGQGSKLVGRIDGLEFGASPQNQDGGGQGYGNQGGYGNGGGQQRQGNGGGQRQAPQQQRPQGNGQQRQQPQRQAQGATQGGGFAADGFSDMDDDIPFITSSYMADVTTSKARRLARCEY